MAKTVKARKVTPRVSKGTPVSITPRNNNPKAVPGMTSRCMKVAEVKFHVKRQK